VPRRTMTIELRMLAWSAILGLVHIVLAVLGATSQYGAQWNVGMRDTPQPPLTGVAGRLQRASHNFLETFPLFVAVILIADAVNQHGRVIVFGAQLYFWGRLAYLALYAAGIRIARTIAWVLATLGIVLIIFALL
jgi:uncharacterized MAPEG superfamily protein